MFNIDKDTRLVLYTTSIIYNSYQYFLFLYFYCPYLSTCLSTSLHPPASISTIYIAHHSKFFKNTVVAIYYKNTTYYINFEKLCNIQVLHSLFVYRKLLLLSATVIIVVMELELGLALFPDINKFEMNKESTSEPHPKKRNFGEAFDQDDCVLSTANEIPRTLALFSWNNDHTKKSDTEDAKANYSLYVKVKMEGVAIARKVNLGQHHSYHSLATTLLHMFGKCKLQIYQVC